MKKFLLMLITLLALSAIAYLTYQNKANQTLIIYLWAGFFAGMIVDFGLCNVFKNTKDLNAYKNKYEKISVDNIDKVAGPALGAVPIATAISLESKKPLLMIRKEKKSYGTSKLIEGELIEGDEVIVVEDVTTTGGSLIKAIKAIQENGGNVKRAFVIVDRLEGAIEAFEKEGIK